MLVDTIFREYDIRGTYPNELNHSEAVSIGAALGSFLQGKKWRKVVVARDDRLSSPGLAKGLITGLLSTGCDVVDIGISITPVIHFLTCVRDFDAGVIVTASHNPADYNGFRIDYRHAFPMYGEDIKHLAATIKEGKFLKGKGVYRAEDLTKDYIEYYSTKTLRSDLKVVVDCGNGAVSALAEKVFVNLGINVIPVACALDGNFPNGVPNPEDPKYMERLGKEVQQNGADIGFAFDTDADRLGVVDAQGKFYSADKLLVLFAQDLARTNTNFKVIYDVKCSAFVSREIEKLGGCPVMLRTGHPFYMLGLQETGALLGAEFSGHIFFKDDYYGYDDGVYAAYRLLAIMTTKKQSLAKLMDWVPQLVSTPEILIPCPDAKKEEVINEIMQQLGEGNFLKVLKVDGIRAEASESGWFLIRASNTTPNISVRAEGKNTQELNMLLVHVAKLLAPFAFLDLTKIKSVA